MFTGTHYMREAVLESNYEKHRLEWVVFHGFASYLNGFWNRDFIGDHGIDTQDTTK